MNTTKLASANKLDYAENVINLQANVDTKMRLEINIDSQNSNKNTRDNENTSMSFNFSGGDSPKNN